MIDYESLSSILKMHCFIENRDEMLIHSIQFVNRPRKKNIGQKCLIKEK